MEAAALKGHLGAVTGKGKPDGKEQPQLAAQLAAQTVLTNKLASEPARVLLADALKKIAPEGAVNNQGVPLLEVAMLGWAAALSGNAELAEIAAAKAATSQGMRPRTWSELIRTQLSISSLGAAAGESLTAAAVSGRCRALDALDQCVMTFMQLHDIAGVHAGCQLIWNTALLLLQHNLHARVKHVFTTAAKALTDVSSPLKKLRALLHAELALCDADDDLVVSAKTQTALALGQDYLDTPSEVAHFQHPRPLDRHLLPLQRALDLKSNMYDEPTNARDWAVLYIERAREAKSLALQDDYLAKAIAMLDTLPMVQAPTQEEASGAGGAELHHDARDLMQLWAGVVKVAWRRWSHVPVCTAAPRVQWFVWSAEVDREMSLLQVSLRSVCSRTFADRVGAL